MAVGSTASSISSSRSGILILSESTSGDLVVSSIVILCQWVFLLIVFRDISNGMLTCSFTLQNFRLFFL